jgi:integrase
MARKVRDSRLEARSNRLKLVVRRKPYSGPSLGRGISLLYRRNRTNGSWVVKASDGHGSYWTKAFAEADDYDNSDGRRVLDFYQAQDMAKGLARGATTDAAPITVDTALNDYQRDLEARGARAYNSTWARLHLTSTLLAKPLAILTSTELRKWRDSLLDKVAPATVNRICKGFRAALELASQHDERIANRRAWEVGLQALPDTQAARNVVISDDKVRAFVCEAYAVDDKLGLIVDLLATTGTRPGQAVRLRVDDLLDHPTTPKLMMPKSGKGGGRNRSQKKHERYSVPITPQLAAKLKESVRGRAGNTPLLQQLSGRPWPADPAQAYREQVRKIVSKLELDPDQITIYALRHSSITRALLGNVPVRLVAASHDTSIGMIEKNYARYIAEHGDDHARAALLVT